MYCVYEVDSSPPSTQKKRLIFSWVDVIHFPDYEIRKAPPRFVIRWFYIIIEEAIKIIVWCTNRKHSTRSKRSESVITDKGLTKSISHRHVGLLKSVPTDIEISSVLFPQTHKWAFPQTCRPLKEHCNRHLEIINNIPTNTEVSQRAFP